MVQLLLLQLAALHEMEVGLARLLLQVDGLSMQMLILMLKLMLMLIL